MNTEAGKRIVVVGGGFAGIEAARKLARLVPQAQITLVSDKTYFEYYPALYKVVTGALPTEVSIPLWMMFDTTPVNVIEDRIIDFLPAENQVRGASGSEYGYDYLVVALGSQTNYFGIPGLDALSYNFRSVHEAIRLKRHLYTLFSDCAAHPADQTKLLTVVIVGGGPSGVELAGNIGSYLRGLARARHIDPKLITIDLIEAAPRILPTLPEAASKRAAKRLARLGVNVLAGQTLMQEDLESITLKSGAMKTKTVIWTAGMKINDAFKNIPNAALNEKKRIVVDDSLALPNHQNIFVIGDGAGTPHAGLAQTAIHNARYVAETISKKIEGKKIKPYEPKRTAFVVPIGNWWAIFAWKGIRLYGIIPALLRQAIDLRYYFSLLSLNRFWYVLRSGKKYRNDPDYCPPEATRL